MQGSPYIPRGATLERLQQSRNAAVISTLTCGISSAIADVRHLSLKSLLERDEATARRAVLLHWDQYDQRDLDLIAEKRKSFSAAATQMLNSGSPSQRELALAAISALSLSDSMAAVLDIMLDPEDTLSSAATECFLGNCVRWGDASRSGAKTKGIPRKLHAKLEQLMKQFDQHDNGPLVEAWLACSHWDDSAQLAIIGNPDHPAHGIVLHKLRTSTQPYVFQLLAGYLMRGTTPARVLQIAKQRPEPELARQLAIQSSQGEVGDAMLQLSRLPPLSCFDQIEETIESSDPQLHHRLWLLTAATSDDLVCVLRGAVRLAEAGSSADITVAAQMLDRCKRPSIESLLSALQTLPMHTGPTQRDLGYYVDQVARWLKTDSPMLKGSAKRFFAEFSLAHLLAQVRRWPMQLCSTMARIVLMIEPAAEEQLLRELHSPARQRRLDALQVCYLLRLQELMEQQLPLLLEDPQLEVRVKAIELLGSLESQKLLELLPRLLDDANTDVQDAAAAVLRRQGHRKSRPVPEPVLQATT